MTDNKPKILVGIPTKPTSFTDFWTNLIDRLNEWSSVFQIEPIYDPAYPLDAARNRIADRAIKINADYLFFLDSDILIPQDGLEKLVSYNLNIVSGIYCYKFSPYLPIIKRKEDNDVYMEILDYENITEVDGIGMGCCLIKTDVFRTMKKNHHYPWFKNEWLEISNDRYEVLSEDLYFCKMAQKSGFKINVDLTTQCEHMAINGIPFDLHKPLLKKVKESEKIRTEIIKELAEFTNLSIGQCWQLLKHGTEYLADEYNNSIDKENIYKNSTNYLFDLANWHTAQRQKFDFLLMNVLTNAESKLNRKINILDFGSGIGQNSILLAEVGLNVSMMDFDSKMSQFARFRAKKRNLNIPFYDLEKIDFNNNNNDDDNLSHKFDIILCYDVLEHIPDDEFENTINNLLKLKNEYGAILLTTNFGKSVTYPMHYDLSEDKTKLLEKLIDSQKDSIFNNM